MFGIDSQELLVIAVVALVVIGPKDLPRVMRTIGEFVGRARGMAKHFRTGIDAMIRETELEDMEKKWKADNERIMREHPEQGSAAIEQWPEPAADELPAPPRPRASKASAGPKAPPARGKAPPRRAAPPIPAPKATPPAGETP
ncbi:MAG: sec-independent protein translocase protein TatB [Sphingomonadales bacterium]|jgi:sec-independent protein translocase protein TatB|nr:sec-independent protein translocase protein TatB [Sphingomonadales bacterium]MEA3043455.1 sec-independent protein translocase protein TatB [Sphingomonadales bacterium]MEA3045718.1 sec-independent protein translocase protein TatB [Sphingomonadales bacterium]